MLLTCRCLNVSLRVIGEGDRLQDMIVTPDSLHLSEDAVDDDFFNDSVHNIAAVILKDNNSITEGDDSAIAERRQCAEYSSVFQVVLPKKNSIVPLVDTFTAGNESGFFQSGANNVSRYALHVVQDMMAQCMKREQQAMEERIQKFADEQQAAFEQFKAQAKCERAALLSVLAYHQSTAYCGLSYDDDEENDSAVPLSPLSLTSGDPSPAFGVFNNGQLYYDNCVPCDVLDLSRPKALSNPASLTSWKRKRHSGGSGKAPALTSYPEEQHDTIFSFEDHENIAPCGFYRLPDDDEDTDDSGASSGDYSQYYPSTNCVRTTENDCSNFGNKRVNNGDNNSLTSSAADRFFGKSLPVTISAEKNGALCQLSPNARNYDIQQQQDNEGYNFDDAKLPYVDDFRGTRDELHCDSSKLQYADNFDLQVRFDDNNNDNVFENNPVDVGAGMLALARSVRAEDDPERLFGERPHRRRYKTASDDVICCDVTAAKNNHSRRCQRYSGGNHGDRSSVTQQQRSIIITVKSGGGHRRPSAF